MHGNVSAKLLFLQEGPTLLFSIKIAVFLELILKCGRYGKVNEDFWVDEFTVLVVDHFEN